MAKDKKNIPHECYQKAFNIFGCSYAFCSSDGKALLMKTSREDCEEIGTWYVIDIGSLVIYCKGRTIRKVKGGGDFLSGNIYFFCTPIEEIFFFFTGWLERFFFFDQINIGDLPPVAKKFSVSLPF